MIPVINSKKKNSKELHLWFFSLWNKMEHRECQNCGSEVYNFSTANFDHLLEKKKYPEYEFNEDNIFFCCLKCHDNKTRGFPGKKHLDAINNFKEKYGLKNNNY